MLDKYRDAFRRMAVGQRQLISDLQLFADDARTELDALKKKADEQKSQEERVREIQIGNLLSFTESAVQRLGKSRT